MATVFSFRRIKHTLYVVIHIVIIKSYSLWAYQPLSPCAVVSDSLYPKDAFSIGDEQDGENAVEVEDMNECLIYEGNICHHRCVNTPGSYRCECFPGYVLQEDAFTCAQGTVKATNLVLSHSANRYFQRCQDTGKQLSVPFFSLRYDLQSTFLSGRPHLL